MLLQQSHTFAVSYSIPIIRALPNLAFGNSSTAIDASAGAVRVSRAPSRGMDSYSERGELSVLFNGTIVDEQDVLAVCLGHLYIGTRQVVRSLTRSGFPPSTGREQALSYIRENFEGLSEETLADFLAKNREQHPVEPDLNSGGRLTCL